MKAIGTKTERRTNVIAMIGAVISAIAFFVASRRRQVRFFLHDAFDVFDDDDRVVDQDADRQHHREQRYRIGRIAHHQQHREGADHADRHGDRGNEGRAQTAEKEEDDDDDQRKGDQQRDQHVVDRGLDEGGRVVIDQVFETGREALAQAIEIGSDCGSGVHGIRAGRKIDPDRHRRLAVEAAFGVLVLGAELDPCDIAHAQQGAVGIGAQDDVAELLGRRQAALGLHVHLKLLVVADRAGADPADRRLRRSAPGSPRSHRPGSSCRLSRRWVSNQMRIE